jgi:hypothetical protein
MMDILDPQPGETIYDPACGTGGMLLATIVARWVYEGVSPVLLVYVGKSLRAKRFIPRLYAPILGVIGFNQRARVLVTGM